MDKVICKKCGTRGIAGSKCKACSASIPKIVKEVPIVEENVGLWRPKENIELDADLEDDLEDED